MLLLQLLMTIPTLLASPGSAAPPISYCSQGTVGELTAHEYSALAAWHRPDGSRSRTPGNPREAACVKMLRLRGFP